jgi:hypothetical protein
VYKAWGACHIVFQQCDEPSASNPPVLLRVRFPYSRYDCD